MRKSTSESGADGDVPRQFDLCTGWHAVERAAHDRVLEPFLVTAGLEPDLALDLDLDRGQRFRRLVPDAVVDRGRLAALVRVFCALGD